MIRIVKMTFEPESVDEFLGNFESNKALIRAFDGVQHLALMQDKNAANVYFTYSIWQSEAHLENYRNSDLFKGIWAKTKPLFSAKAEAWSVDKLEELA